jgi:thiamine-phosphate diphosphorylase
MTAHISSLYAIIDPTFLRPGVTVADYARQLLSGGCRTIQLRVKATDDVQVCREQRYAATRDLMALKKEYDYCCIINDDLTCAREFDADGVHVGCDDTPIAEARSALGPRALIGYSAHSIAEARTAEVGGASYVALGAIYPTVTKGAGHPIQGVTRLAELVQQLTIPTVAIGGIGRDNVATVWETGVSSVAMITGLCRVESPRCEVVWYLQQLQR